MGAGKGQVVVEGEQGQKVLGKENEDLKARPQAAGLRSCDLPSLPTRVWSQFCPCSDPSCAAREKAQTRKAGQASRQDDEPPPPPSQIQHPVQRFLQVPLFKKQSKKEQGPQMTHRIKSANLLQPELENAWQAPAGRAVGIRCD